MVQQTIPHFAVFDFPPSENPIETFEMVSEVAKWLQVPNQTVYAAVKRGDETKVKNKEGAVFWLKKLEVTLSPQEVVPPAPVPAPRKLSPQKVVPPAPVPAPRKKLSQEVVPPAPVPAPRKLSPQKVVPPAPVPAPRKLSPQKVVPPVLRPSPVPAPRKKLSQEVVLFTPPRKNLSLTPLLQEIPVTPPIPWEVATVLAEGKKTSFQPPQMIQVTTFVSAKTLAKFIKSGLEGKMFAQGAKKKQIMLWNDKLLFLPDLIKEVIVFYIRNQMWEDGDHAGAEAFVEKVMNRNWTLQFENWIPARLLASVRRLDDEFVFEVGKEFMKLIF